jgi:hypothetical protein
MLLKNDLLRLCLLGLLFGGAAPSCSEPSSPPPVEPQFEVPVSDGFTQRQKEYRTYCSDNNGPGSGGIHGQVCRVYTGQTTYNEEVIRNSLAKIDARLDTSDFDINSILRMLWLDRTRNVIPPDLRADMEKTVLGFKYWLTEPGPDDMVWWSENHQVLFHTAEILAGMLFPDTTFRNSGMTGREHIARATPDLLRWMQYRARFGFSEFHSNVYFDEDMPALLNLVDFSDNLEIRAKAAILLDILFFNMATQYFAGRFATPHGRTYPGRLLGGLRDSTTEAAFMGLNNVALVTPEETAPSAFQLAFIGEDVPMDSIAQVNASNFTGAHLSTSDFYAAPEILERIANHRPADIEIRQRDGIDVLDGPKYGITYSDWNDIMFWWGMTGYVDPEIIEGTFNKVEHFTMWEGNEFRNFQFLRPLVGTSVFRSTAEALKPMTRGVVLETANVYTYRTPHYQLSGLQDWKPSSWTAQVHAWKATIDAQAYVFTSYPGGMSGDYMAGLWTGGFMPRVTLHKSVGIIQYRRPEMPKLQGVLDRISEADVGLSFVDYTHAYFPRNAFDEVVQANGWTIAAKGDAYVGLWSQHPTTWSTENDYQLIADARENVWIIEMGDRTNHGSFADFAEALFSAEIHIADDVRYDSPFRGLYQVGWSGDFTVDGEMIDLGPYKRFDSMFSQQEFNTKTTEIEFDGQRLVLDFARAQRMVE